MTNVDDLIAAFVRNEDRASRELILRDLLDLDRGFCPLVRSGFRH